MSPSPRPEHRATANPHRPPRTVSPGWPEIGIGLLTYLLILGPLIVWLAASAGHATASRGNVGGAVNGIAGIAALLAASAWRVRTLSAFGFRATGRRWLACGAGLGLLAFGLSFLIEGVYFHFIDEANTQADFQVAAKGGALSLAMLILTGGILTPLGEEFLFRGVIASALKRYGAWVCITASSLIFAASHGPSVIFLLAFMVGMQAAWLFFRTDSLWPGVVLHIVYNSLHLLYYATL